jgi:branched-chain amino acid transport system substrate-binding protein
LVAAACGSRLSTKEILAQNVLGRTGAGTAASQASDQSAGPAVGTADGTAANAGAGGAQAAGPGASGQSGRVQAGGPASGTGGSSSATKAPIVVGFVGSLSGIGGPTLIPARDGWVAWQKMVNARGGINGHPVQLLVGDDGNNESRALAIARDFVENKGAIAISSGSASVSALAKYSQGRSLPVVGSVPGSPDWNQTPMLFPPFGTQVGWGAAQLAKNAGVKKVATVYCVESGTCKYADDAFVAAAKAEGLQVVYQGGISITQPDYTAECLQMKSAGAELVYPVTENSSSVRLAQSCSRQGFRPTWEVAGGTDAMTKIPEYEGAISAEPAFPWFVRSGSPAVDEYVQALQKYAPNLLSSGVDSQAWGWVSAMLFEKAAANVSDKPTSQDILNGLWAMKGETLGGLDAGGVARTFTRGQPTPDVSCVFGATIRGGKWEAPQGPSPAFR